MRIRSWRRWLCGSIAVRLLLPTVALILVGLLLLTASPAAADEDQPPQELPGPVIDLTLTPHADRVVVSWGAPQTGGAPTGYIVHLKPEGGEHGSGKTKRPKAKKTKVTFNKIEPGTTYLVWARARNKAGKGDRVHARVTTPAPADQPVQQLQREDQRPAEPEPEPQPKDPVAPAPDDAQGGEKPIRQVWYGVRWETPEPSTEPALVSNFGQDRSFFDFPTNNYVHSQGFTTGDSESVLESVGASIRTVLNVAHIATIKAEIWSADAGGEPDQKLVELIVPRGWVRGATWSSPRRRTPCWPRERRITSCSTPPAASTCAWSPPPRWTRTPGARSAGPSPTPPTTSGRRRPRAAVGWKSRPKA